MAGQGWITMSWSSVGVCAVWDARSAPHLLCGPIVFVAGLLSKPFPRLSLLDVANTQLKLNLSVGSTRSNKYSE